MKYLNIIHYVDFLSSYLINELALFQVQEQMRVFKVDEAL